MSFYFTPRLWLSLSDAHFKDGTSFPLNRQRWHIHEHAQTFNAMQCSRKHAGSHTFTRIHNSHVFLWVARTSFSRTHTHTHSHLDYKAVTDLPMEEPHKPRQTAWTAVKISTSAVSQLHNCECRFCGRSSWMGHGSKPHVFLMIRLSALAHETAQGTQFLTAHLYVAYNSAEIPCWLLVLWARDPDVYRTEEFDCLLPKASDEIIKQ